MDALNYEISNSKRRVASLVVSRLQTLDHKNIGFIHGNNGWQSMCQFLCQFDSFFDEQ